jgi:hypothetical protein
MSDFENENVNDPEPEDVEEMFENLDNLPDVPANGYITLTHDSAAPMFAPLLEGEQSITIRTAIERKGLTLGSAVNAYYDGGLVDLDTQVPAGAVVTLVGNVKGG